MTTKLGNPCFRTIFTYHEICPRDAKLSLYSVGVDEFRQHLRAYKTWARTEFGPFVSVTFDDGHISNCNQALPLLAETDIIATFFVTAGWIDHRPDFMTWAHLRELVRAGHSVQSHSWSHQLLTCLSPQELKKELTKSKITLEDRLGTPVDAISMPGGRWNSTVLTAVAEAGYKYLYHSEPWNSHTVGSVPGTSEPSLVKLGRFMVKRADTVQDLERNCRLSVVSRCSLRLQDSAKRAVRNLIGEHRYEHMWRTLAGRGQS